jgi:polyisoprenoid-binding protein YceI
MTPQLEADQTAGDLTLHTGRAGIGSNLGHDLTMRVGEWSGSADLDDDGAVTGLRVVAHVRSLQVVRGEGGLKPLSRQDHEAIVTHALQTLRARTQPEILFEAGGMQLVAGFNTVAGRLTIVGVTRPMTLTVVAKREGERLRIRAHGQVLQTDFGLTPYSGMMGLLKVRDRVEVRGAFSVLAGAETRLA